ncbi:MAG: hypothetical protein D6741_13660 [Planctomycetota bacterium]|nr:MAG: hypothetical protein D6741_13660 [Planctomycetota bacterium]
MSCRIRSRRWLAGSLAAALCGVLCCVGCGNTDNAPADQSETPVVATPTGGSAASDRQSGEVRSAVVQKLLEALDDSDASPEEKRAVREMLLEADEQLAASLEGNARRPSTAAGNDAERSYVPPKAIADARARLAESGLASPRSDDEAQTTIIRTLLELLDEITTPDEDSEDVVRDALLNADAELREALGNRKALIERANRRAPSPTVFNPSPERSPEQAPNDTSAKDDSEPKPPAGETNSP